MSPHNKKRPAIDMIVDEMKTLRLGEEAEEAEGRSNQVEEQRNKEVDSMAEDEAEVATLLHMVEDAAIKFSLSKSDSTKIKLIQEGRILSMYRWSEDMEVRAGEVDLGVTLQPLMRLDTLEDVNYSYSLR